MYLWISIIFISFISCIDGLRWRMTATPDINTCKNCMYFKSAPASLQLHTEYNSKWNKCQKFNDYVDYCRVEEALCGPSGKHFLHKNYTDSFIDIYEAYADFLFKSKTE